MIQAAREGHEEQDDGNPVIIAEAETPVHEMAVSDAVMQMDLSDRPFIVFRNGSHGEINVVYRRDDGNIGWIDPAALLRSSSVAAAHNKVSSKGPRSRGAAATQPNAKKARKRR